MCSVYPMGYWGQCFLGQSMVFLARQTMDTELESLATTTKETYVVANLLLWAEVVAANLLFVPHKSIECQAPFFVGEAMFDLNDPVLLKRSQELLSLLWRTVWKELTLVLKVDHGRLKCLLICIASL